MTRFLVLILASASWASAQVVVALGDSTGEAVQSADASWATQLIVYSNLVAGQMGASYPQPLILSNPFATVFSTVGRFRFDPNLKTHDLAFSGAKLADALRERPTAPLDSESDLVLSPYSGSQVEIIESLSPDLTLCWIGSDDALSAILAYDRLDASQLTPVSQFEADFAELSRRVGAASKRVVFANIPNLTNIAFTMDPADLAAYAGSDFGLPPGYRTSLVIATALRLKLVDASVLSDPSLVLDPTEVATIQNRIDTFNGIIAKDAAAIGAPVVDLASLFDQIEANGYPLFGITLRNKMLGGVFSLDGVHPSNIGHAVIANEFIKTINSYFGLSVPELHPLQMAFILYTDPFVDKDHDGRITGRPYAGLLETFAPLLGLSGDQNDFFADAPVKLTEAGARDFVTQVEQLKAKPTRGKSMSKRAIAAAAAVFGMGKQ